MLQYSHFHLDIIIFAVVTIFCSILIFMHWLCNKYGSKSWFHPPRLRFAGYFWYFSNVNNGSGMLKIMIPYIYAVLLITTVMAITNSASKTCWATDLASYRRSGHLIQAIMLSTRRETTKSTTALLIRNKISEKKMKPATRLSSCWSSSYNLPSPISIAFSMHIHQISTRA